MRVTKYVLLAIAPLATAQVVSSAASGFNSVGSVASNGFNSVGGVASSAVNGVLTQASSGVNGVLTQASSAVNSVLSAASNAVVPGSGAAGLSTPVFFGDRWVFGVGGLVAAGVLGGGLLL